METPSNFFKWMMMGTPCLEMPMPSILNTEGQRKDVKLPLIGYLQSLIDALAINKDLTKNSPNKSYLLGFILLDKRWCMPMLEICLALADFWLHSRLDSM